MTNEEYGRVVAKNLKRLAYQTGKSQVEISKELGINNATLSAWMNGTRIFRHAEYSCGTHCSLIHIYS